MPRLATYAEPGGRDLAAQAMANLWEDIRCGLPVPFDEFLRKHVAAHSAFEEEVLLHLLRAGGNRLRPLLVLLAGQCGGNLGGVIDIAAAVELIHLASLC